MSSEKKTARIHALDSLRAIMMLLGLVIHSAITYGTLDYSAVWLIQDAVSTSIVNDVIVNFIHAFRMQIFFLVAGFFGAMLFYERQPMRMVKNRFSRIVLPFLVFVLLLWPTILFSFTYTGAVINGNENAYSEAVSIFSNAKALIPETTFHLWFLYYLSLITAVSVVIALVFKKLPGLSKSINRVFSTIINKPFYRIIFFAAITAIGYVIMGTSQVATSVSFVPDFNTFLYYFIFYMVGWILFKSKKYLYTFMNYDWLSVIGGCSLFYVYFFMGESLNNTIMIILKSVMVWLFIFGISGVFIRYASKHSAIMRYVSDSSYWVYLIHLSFTAILPSFIAEWQIPAVLKFAIVLGSTSVISIVSYHYMVRGTFIGKFLNGRTYTRKLSDINKSVEINSNQDEAIQHLQTIKP